MCKACNQVWGMFYAARARAKKHNLPFDITKEDIFSIWPKDNCCPIFGTPFRLNRRKGSHSDSPTLDKIIPERGYVKDNVAVISWAANVLKQDSVDPEIFRRLANYIEAKLRMRGI